MSKQNQTTPVAKNVVPPTPTTTESATENVASLQGANRALFANNDDASADDTGAVATAPSDAPKPLRKCKQSFSVKKKYTDNKKGKFPQTQNEKRIVKTKAKGAIEELGVNMPTCTVMGEEIKLSVS